MLPERFRSGVLTRPQVQREQERFGFLKPSVFKHLDECVRRVLERTVPVLPDLLPLVSFGFSTDTLEKLTS